MPSRTVIVEVKATAHWVDTGLTVNADQQVSLRTTSGSWTANPATGMVGAAGNLKLPPAHSGYVLPGAPEGLLVGKVGDTVFPVGNGAKVPAGATGPLSLSINDDVSAAFGKGFADNEGSLMVEITVASFADPPGSGMRFRDDGTPIPRDEVVPGAHATDDLDGFAAWLGDASPEVVGRVYAALEVQPDPTRSDAIAHSRAKLLLVAAGPQRDQAKNALGKLAKNQWWKLFIDRGAQDPRQSSAQNAMRFDLESSPGYYAAMMRAYEQVLAPAEEGLRSDLGPEDLIAIHAMVTAGTLSRSDQTFVPTPHALSGKDTTFPMTKREGDLPSAVAFEEMAASQIIGMDPRAKGPYVSPIVEGDSPKQRYLKRATAASTGPSMTLLRPLDTYLIDTNYEQNQAPPIMGSLLDTYYEERGQADQLQGAKQDAAKLGAIVKLIRALHTAHLFTDANGRLNTMVLLNKLLIEEGFDPVIMDDTSVFGGGFSITQLAGQVTRGMNTFSQEARGNAPWGIVARGYGWFTYAENNHPADPRVTLLHVIGLDLAQVPDKHRTKVADAMNQFQPRAYSTTRRGDAIETLGFQQSMDAMLLENELETLTRD